MRMTKNYFLFLVDMLFVQERQWFYFFITLKFAILPSFINLTRNWLFPGINIFQRFFHIHATLSGNILRCIHDICEKKEIKSVSTVQYQVMQYLYIAYVQTLANIKCKTGIYGPPMLLPITQWYLLSSYSSRKWFQSLQFNFKHSLNKVYLKREN